jgi:hypothetical protein
MFFSNFFSSFRQRILRRAGHSFKLQPELSPARICSHQPDSRSGAFPTVDWTTTTAWSIRWQYQTRRSSQTDGNAAQKFGSASSTKPGGSEHSFKLETIEFGHENRGRLLSVGRATRSEDASEPGRTFWREKCAKSSSTTTADSWFCPGKDKFS